VRGWPRREYRIRAAFRAPIPFVFAWCTDISPIDPELRRKKFVRKVVEKTSSRVVYEDLEASDRGWTWDRNVVTRMPPDRWTLRAVGNHFDTRADYLLSTARAGRTRLDLRFRLRPKTSQDRLPGRRALERDVGIMWRRYARALERDYLMAWRTALPPPRSPRGARRADDTYRPNRAGATNPARRAH
jgi:hypothetical protein